MLKKYFLITSMMLVSIHTGYAAAGTPEQELSGDFSQPRTSTSALAITSGDLMQEDIRTAAMNALIQYAQAQGVTIELKDGEYELGDTLNESIEVTFNLLEMVRKVAAGEKRILCSEYLAKLNEILGTAFTIEGHELTPLTRWTPKQQAEAKKLLLKPDPAECTHAEEKDHDQLACDVCYTHEFTIALGKIAQGIPLPLSDQIKSEVIGALEGTNDRYNRLTALPTSGDLMQKETRIAARAALAAYSHQNGKEWVIKNGNGDYRQKDTSNPAVNAAWKFLKDAYHVADKKEGNLFAADLEELNTLLGTTFTVEGHELIAPVQWTAEEQAKAKELHAKLKEVGFCANKSKHIEWQKCPQCLQQGSRNLLASVSKGVLKRPTPANINVARQILAGTDTQFNNLIAAIDNPDNLLNKYNFETANNAFKALARKHGWLIEENGSIRLDNACTEEDYKNAWSILCNISNALNANKEPESFYQASLASLNKILGATYSIDPKKMIPTVNWDAAQQVKAKELLAKLKHVDCADAGKHRDWMACMTCLQNDYHFVLKQAATGVSKTVTQVGIQRTHQILAGTDERFNNLIAAIENPNNLLNRYNADKAVDALISHAKKNHPDWLTQRSGSYSLSASCTDIDFRIAWNLTCGIQNAYETNKEPQSLYQESLESLNKVLGTNYTIELSKLTPVYTWTEEQKKQAELVCTRLQFISNSYCFDARSSNHDAKSCTACIRNAREALLEKVRYDTQTEFRSPEDKQLIDAMLAGTDEFTKRNPDAIGYEELYQEVVCHDGYCPHDSPCTNDSCHAQSMRWREQVVAAYLRTCYKSATPEQQAILKNPESKKLLAALRDGTDPVLKKERWRTTKLKETKKTVKKLVKSHYTKDELQDPESFCFIDDPTSDSTASDNNAISDVAQAYKTINAEIEAYEEYGADAPNTALLLAGTHPVLTKIPAQQDAAQIPLCTGVDPARTEQLRVQKLQKSFEKSFNDRREELITEIWSTTDAPQAHAFITGKSFTSADTAPRGNENASTSNLARNLGIGMTCGGAATIIGASAKAYRDAYREVQKEQLTRNVVLNKSDLHKAAMNRALAVPLKERKALIAGFALLLTGGATWAAAAAA